jgi:hypothetical protein
MIKETIFQLRLELQNFPEPSLKSFEIAELFAISGCSSKLRGKYYKSHAVAAIVRQISSDREGAKMTLWVRMDLQI